MSQKYYAIRLDWPDSECTWVYRAGAEISHTSLWGTEISHTSLWGGRTLFYGKNAAKIRLEQARAKWKQPWITLVRVRRRGPA